jgi:hypothetical protein
VKIGINLKRNEEALVETYYTNLFVICEWERLEGRRVTDGRGVGASELSCWLWIILKLKGEDVGANWREWLQANPDYMIVEGTDLTDPNPTGAAVSAAKSRKS